MSYRPTPEQKQAARERRRELAGLTRRLAGMTEAERSSFTHGLTVTIEGHTLSLTNQMLIAIQATSHVPPTLVGGFRQWQKAGRVVKRGEHGYAIWAPISRKRAEDQTADEPDMAEADSKPGFILATVFDITQTEPLTDHPITGG